MKTTKEMAQDLRKLYKKKGWNNRMVGVQVNYGSIDSSIVVIVKDVRVPYGEAMRIAKGAEHIDRCEMSGEILGGGNCFVHIRLMDTVEMELTNRYREAVQNAIAVLETASSSCIVSVEGSTAGLSKEHAGCFRTWIDNRAGMMHFTAGTAALEIALTDPDQR